MLDRCIVTYYMEGKRVGEFDGGDR